MLKDKHIITDLESVKVISDSFRLKILATLKEKGQASAAEVGRELDQSPSKISYHLKLMEKHGLIKLVDTEIKGNLMEKYYAPVAKNFEIQLNTEGNKKDIEIEGKNECNKLLKNAISYVTNDLNKYEFVKGDSVIAYDTYYLTEEEVDELRKTVMNKLSEFDERDPKDEKFYKYQIGLIMLKKRKGE